MRGGCGGPPHEGREDRRKDAPIAAKSIKHFVQYCPYNFWRLCFRATSIGRNVAFARLRPQEPHPGFVASVDQMHSMVASVDADTKATAVSRARSRRRGEPSLLRRYLRVAATASVAMQTVSSAKQEATTWCTCD
jgi:hypothetical protein